MPAKSEKQESIETLRQRHAKLNGAKSPPRRI